jgi:hypothetical protein
MWVTIKPRNSDKYFDNVVDPTRLGLTVTVTFSAFLKVLTTSSIFVKDSSCVCEKLIPSNENILSKFPSDSLYQLSSLGACSLKKVSSSMSL